MNARRMLIVIGAATALAAAALPGTAAAHDRGYYGPQHGYGHGHGHGRYKPWKHGPYGYARPVVVPPPFYAVPYPRYVPAPIYAPPPVYYPPVRGGFTFIWNGGW
ncbi:MAG: hypothetical protein MUF80_04300 [Burkholderiales bacterium]|nr:hypothetical protein [Burkholderiales bacterium]